LTLTTDLNYINDNNLYDSVKKVLIINIVLYEKKQIEKEIYKYVIISL